MMETAPAEEKKDPCAPPSSNFTTDRAVIKIIDEELYTFKFLYGKQIDDFIDGIRRFGILHVGLTRCFLNHG